MECVNCRHELAEGSETFEYDSLPGTYLKDMTVYECPNCGETYRSIPQIEELDRTLAKLVISQSSRLTGKEVKFLRKYLGLSQDDLARKMGVEAESISRWENDRQRMSEPNERLLRSIAAHETPVEDYRQAVPDGPYEEAKEWQAELTNTDDHWDPAAA